MIVDLPYPVPHPGQEKVLEQSKRFNIIRCGVRWGKTTLAEYLVKKATDNPLPIAYYCPTYKDLEPFWQIIKSDLGPIITDKSEAQKQIKTVTGTTIDFWSLENPDSSRGRSYALAVIDEARKIKDLEYAWNQTIRGRLLDYQGSAWIISSPQGHGTYLNMMYEQASKNPNWYTYTASSFENPYLSQDELDAAALTMDDLSYQQEIMGEDVEWTASARFYSAFDRARHVQPCTYKRLEPLGLSFDFNVDPMTCIAYQTDAQTFFHVIKEFRQSQSEVYEVCTAIKQFFETDHIPNYRITGDSSGNSRNAGVRGGKSNYDIIRSELYLGSGQIVTPKSNMRIDPSDHAGSRTLVNSVLQNFPDFRIDPSCEWLIKDMEFVLRGLDTKGRVTIKKDDTVNPFINMKNNELGHLADALRYSVHTELKSFLKVPQKAIDLDVPARRAVTFEPLKVSQS